MPATYSNCRCPGCKTRLDEVACDTEYCPRCGRELEPADVWQTRSYGGILALPRWVKALLPLGLALAGAAMMLAKPSGVPGIRRAPIGMIVFGVIGFFYIMAGGDETE